MILTPSSIPRSGPGNSNRGNGPQKITTTITTITTTTIPTTIPTLCVGSSSPSFVVLVVVVGIVVSFTTLCHGGGGRPLAKGGGIYRELKGLSLSVIQNAFDNNSDGHVCMCLSVK